MLVLLQRKGVGEIGITYRIFGQIISFIPNLRFLNTFLTKHIIQILNILCEDSNLIFFKNLIILFFRRRLGFPVPKHRIFRNNPLKTLNFSQYFIFFYFWKPELLVTQSYKNGCNKAIYKENRKSPLTVFELLTIVNLDDSYYLK